MKVINRYNEDVTSSFNELEFAKALKIADIIMVSGILPSPEVVKTSIGFNGQILIENKLNMKSGFYRIYEDAELFCKYSFYIDSGNFLAITDFSNFNRFKSNALKKQFNENLEKEIGFFLDL